ncbi:MAG TPA: site-specific integrase [Pyrinomonadaceae bacterium]|jgi:integrase
MPVENRGTAKRPRWRYAFTIRGVRYRASIPEARTKYEAEQAETEARQAVFQGRYGRPAGARDFADFVEKEYEPWAKETKRSWRNESYCLPTVKERFRGKTFAQISPLLIEKYKRDLRESNTKKETKFSPRYVNYHLQILFRIFSLAVERKEISAEDNPCRKVKFLDEDNRRTRYLLDEEARLLFAQLEGDRAHLRPMIIVAVGTGMRLGDQLNLRKSQVDFQRNVINVPNAKTGRDYPVPMNQEVREVLRVLARENQASAYLFVNPRTGKPYTCIKRAFASACSDANISGLRWHDLRHTFGTRLAEAGCSEATIAELMRHTDPKTTRRYTHATDRAKHAAVEATRPRTQGVENEAAKVISIQK